MPQAQATLCDHCFVFLKSRFLVEMEDMDSHPLPRLCSVSDTVSRAIGKTVLRSDYV